MDWFELIIFAAVVLFGLLFGDKKKKQQQQRGGSSPAVRRPPSRRGTQRTQPTGRSQTSPASESDPLTIAEQIFERMHREERESEEWNASLEPMHTTEAISLEGAPPEERSLEALGWEVGAGEIGTAVEGLETLEPAGEASHLRFHERYIEPLAETPISRPSRPRVYLTPQAGREAIVWMAVFGRPKGLD